MKIKNVEEDVNEERNGATLIFLVKPNQEGLKHWI